MNKLILSYLSLLSITYVGCTRKNEDKLLLSPVELIDLVQKEQQKNQQPLEQKHFAADASYDQEENKDIYNPGSEELCEVEKTLKSRKVWSRWSKWGECSVTCGEGTIVRHRLCVAGRCAPGEREEQRRPCARAPCLTPLYNMTDELREIK